MLVKSSPLEDRSELHRGRPVDNVYYGIPPDSAVTAYNSISSDSFAQLTELYRAAIANAEYKPGGVRATA